MKNTLLRVIESSNNNYNFLEIQLLEDSSNSGNVFKGMISSYGSITFQQNKGETEWYGMNYVVHTDRFKDLDLFHRVAKRVSKETDYKSQPEDVIRILNGKKYFLLDGEFFAESDKGKRCFMVLRNGDGYARMVAANETEAIKKLNKYLALPHISSTYSLGDSFPII